MESENHLYNVMTQLTQEMKSAWRIEKHYIIEAQSDGEQKLWERMLSEKKQDIESLKEILKQSLS